MKSSSRRRFLGALGAVASAPFALRSSVAYAAEKSVSKEFQVGGFYVGAQAWSFNRFTAVEALEFNAQAGAKVIEFFPGQKFKPNSDKPWGHDSDADTRAEMKDLLAKHGVRFMNYGVVGIPNNEEGARKIFDFAKEFQLYGVTTESVDAIDLIEKLAQEYDIKVGIHNHPERKNDPNYKVWNPEYVLSVVKDRHKNVGACADTGHWLRSGIDPLASLKLLGDRVVSSHFKDRLDQGSPDVPYGAGKANLIEQLEQLRSVQFEGNISIEYETNWEKNLPDVAQCVGYIRGLGAAKGWG